MIRIKISEGSISFPEMIDSMVNSGVRYATAENRIDIVSHKGIEFNHLESIDIVRGGRPVSELLGNILARR